jgi:hypothetical protein
MLLGRCADEGPEGAMTSAEATTQEDTPPGQQPLARQGILPDAPLVNIQGDRFGYRAYADAVAELIGSESTDTPLALAISGPWGAGKTSLAKMIEDRLRAQPQLDDRQNLFCWFDAWMHDDAPTGPGGGAT